MEEAKLSISMRKKVEYKLRSGEPLPLPRIKSAPPKSNQNLFNMKKNLYFTKRTKQQIQEADDPNTEVFCGKAKVDRTKEKEKLQNLMEFGNKNGLKIPTRQRANPVYFTKEDRMTELAREIEERVKFLDDMTALGQGKRYEQNIKREIAEKLQEVSELQKLDESNFIALQIPYYRETN